MKIIVKTIKEEIYEVEHNNLLLATADIKAMKPQSRRTWQTVRSK